MVLLLDVDGVLQFSRLSFQRGIETDYSWRHGYLEFLNDLFQDPEYLDSLVGESNFLDAADRLLAKHVSGLTAAVFLERWLCDNIELNADLINLLPTLNVEAVYLASNQEPLRGAHVERLYSPFKWLTGSFLSHRMGCRKPSSAYFKRVLADLQCDGRNVIFVDDTQACVVAAREAGIEAIHFENNNQLVSDLVVILEGDNIKS